MPLLTRQVWVQTRQVWDEPDERAKGSSLFSVVASSPSRAGDLRPAARQRETGDLTHVRCLHQDGDGDDNTGLGMTSEFSWREELDYLAYVAELEASHQAAEREEVTQSPSLGMVYPLVVDDMGNIVQ